jgi:hypothetical protein
MAELITSLKLYDNGNLASDHTVSMPGMLVNYTELSKAAKEAGCPVGEWVFLRCSMTDEGLFKDIEWQLTPFDDDRAKETNKKLYDAMVPKKVQEGVRTLRPFDEEEMAVNTMAGLYSREEWDAWGDFQYKDEPAVTRSLFPGSNALGAAYVV